MILRELSCRLSWFPLVVLFLFSSDITESYCHALVHPGWCTGARIEFISGRTFRNICCKRLLGWVEWVTVLLHFYSLSFICLTSAPTGA